VEGEAEQEVEETGNGDDVSSDAEVSVGE